MTLNPVMLVVVLAAAILRSTDWRPSERHLVSTSVSCMRNGFMAVLVEHIRPAQAVAALRPQEAFGQCRCLNNVCRLEA